MLPNRLINEKYVRMIRYVIVGVLTTFVSFSSYWIMYAIFSIQPNLANVISITLAVLFAYITNKLFVFRSKLSSYQLLFIEFLKFMSSRSLTMLMEIIGVYIALEIFQLNELLSKAIVSIIILISNYFLSQFFVFRKNDFLENMGEQ